MLTKSILLSLLSFQSVALPILQERDTFNVTLPKVKIMGTGGTIASKGITSTTTAGYSVGLTVEDLIAAVPDIDTIANLEYVQISNVGSNSLNYTHLIPLYHNISETLESDYNGCVVTHGTDTMEETAFFLDLTLNTSKPVALVGAMRPSTATSADGPMNLYQAVKVAGSDESIGRGSMIILNDRIGSAFWTTKQNADTMDTFRAFEQGYLGTIMNNEIEYYYPPTRANGYHYFDISNVTDASEIPEVIILYSYQGLNPNLIKVAIEELGAKGIVLAGSGAGSWTDSGEIINKEMYEKYNIPIVYSHRTMDGSVPKGDVPDYGIASGFVNPQKARILLQLSLYSGYNEEQIRTVFAGVFGG